MSPVVVLGIVFVVALLAVWVPKARPTRSPPQEVDRPKPAPVEIEILDERPRAPVIVLLPKRPSRARPHA